MTERPHAIARSRQAAPDRFPGLPTLPPDALCDGLIFISTAAEPAPDLRPLREALVALWRGRLSAEHDAPHVLVAAFSDPRLAEATTEPGLPLRRTRSGVLASFADQEPADAQLGSVADGWRRAQVWWHGRRYELELDRLQSQTLVTLWDAPRLTIHTSGSAPPANPEDAPGHGEKLAGKAGLSRVAHAAIGLRRERRDAVGDVEARLRAIDARTRLPAIFKQLMTKRSPGEGGEREPGVLENLQGWLRWHTPLGAGLRSKFTDRMATVEQLLSKGDLDTALRLALALGGGKPGAGRERYPNGLPGLRASLDLAFGPGGGVARIFGAATYDNLRGRYAELAKTLEARGDFRRAAYVHSKLLDDHLQAVLTLERGGLHGEGAKLAMAAELEPTVTIRLLFKADEHAAALGLAKRCGCFDQLAEDSRQTEPAFHAFVVDAWTQALIATSQPLRALQVSDRLAGAQDAPDALLAARRGWLGLAATLAEPIYPEPELLARALLAGPRDEARLAALRERFDAAMLGQGPRPGAVLAAVLGPLTRLAEPDRRDQAVFWREAAKPVLEAYALALIALSPERLGASEFDALRALLDRSRLPVLAFDLSKLAKLHGRSTPKAREWPVPPAGSARPAVRVACVLATGQILAWRESRLLQLFDRHGGLVWQQNLADVAALVPIGAGSDVIVIQDTSDGVHQLTRLATSTQRLHFIGKVRLAAHHDVTTEGQWLVQIEGEIGGLDLVKLCLPVPEIEFLWSARVTERLKAIAFGHAPGRPQWLTRDVSESRRGVLEHWSMSRSGKLETTLCIPWRLDQSIRDPADWFWSPTTHGAPIKTADLRRDALWTSPWTTKTERLAVDYAERRERLGLEGLDRVQVCDLGRPYVWSEMGDTAQTFVCEADGAKPYFTFLHAGQTPLVCLARSTVTASPKASGRANHGRIVFADDNGRLFLLDRETLNVDVL
jgi:hypothetical protein